MKVFNDTIGNRTRDLPACSAVPQPTAPPRAWHVTWMKCGVQDVYKMCTRCVQDVYKVLLTFVNFVQIDTRTTVLLLRA
jgi:hypothetical protein